MDLKKTKDILRTIPKLEKESKEDGGGYDNESYAIIQESGDGALLFYFFPFKLFVGISVQQSCMSHFTSYQEKSKSKAPSPVPLLLF